MLEITIIPALKDNYMYLLHDTKTNTYGIVDPAEAKAALKFIGKLDYILNTHHHWDHTGGNLEIKHRTGAKVIGSAADRKRIPGIDIGVTDGFTFGDIKVEVIAIPGHTSGHIAFYFKEDKVLFTGDTLFCVGCGRIFEGTYEQMYDSLQKLAKIPEETLVYCGHEYTKKNIEFALKIEPNNQELQMLDAKSKDVACTMPSTIKQERLTNPFLRTHSTEIRESLGIKRNMEGKARSDLDIFINLRQLKDQF
ncbi:hydroxyacylglutathione hydrolase [Rickettsiales bacterium]|nr:hydroxyacylglutathione hydrolase [Rickettsiales bacterium]